MHEVPVTQHEITPIRNFLMQHIIAEECELGWGVVNGDEVLAIRVPFKRQRSVLGAVLAGKRFHWDLCTFVLGINDSGAHAHVRTWIKIPTHTLAEHLFHAEELFRIGSEVNFEDDYLGVRVVAPRRHFRMPQRAA